MTINHNTLAGVLEVTAFGSALSGSVLSVFLLDAEVPTSALYGESQVLRLSNIVVGSGGGPLSSLADQAIHKNAYLGDADGSGNYADPNDPTLIMRVVVGTDTGFSQHRWTDPYIVANSSNSGLNGLPSGLDASWVAEKGAGLFRPEIHFAGHPIDGCGGGSRPRVEHYQRDLGRCESPSYGSSRHRHNRRCS